MSNLLEKASIVTTPTAYNNGKILSVKPSIVLGEELVSNGNFSNGSTDWTLGASWSISALGATRLTSVNWGLDQTISNAVNGRTYIVTTEITDYTSGNLQLALGSGGTVNTIGSALGVYVNEFVWTGSSGSIIRFQGNLVGSISNISIKEAIDGDFDFTRNSSATRVNSQGLIEDIQILSGDLVSNGDFSQEGSELITNGDFATDLSGWSNGNSYWQWSSQGAYHPLGSVNNGFNQSFTTQSNKLTFSVEIISGVLAVEFGGVYTFNQSGVYTIYGTTGVVNFKRSGSLECYIDNVSVKEVGQNWTLGTGWSIGDGKAVSDGSANNAAIQSISFNPSTLKIKFEVSDLTQGSVRLFVNKPAFTELLQVSSNGSYEATVSVTSGANNIYFYSTSNFIGSITNVSVIEITDDTNLPRIDYTGGVGHWLFEPQSTNLFPYSEDFSQWYKGNGSSVISNALVSPDGTLNADKFVFDGTNNGRVEKEVPTTNGLDYTFSIYLKNKDIANPTQVWIGLEGGVQGQYITITNEWQRFTTIQTANGTSEYPRVRYNGIGSLYAYGAQFEQNSFATSYIPTNGEVNGVTRLKDAAFGAGNSSLINSTEGVLYAEVAALAEQTLTRYITLSDGTSSNRIIIYITDVGVIKFFVGVGGATQAAKTVSGQTTTNFNKLAVSYKENDMKFYLNGVKVHTDTSALTFPVNTLNVINFAASNGTSSPFFGKAKCLAVFKEALTDAELTCLTTI